MKMIKTKPPVPSTLDINTRVGDNERILIICEDKLNGRRTKLALGNQHDYHIVSTGKEGLLAIRQGLSTSSKECPEHNQQELIDVPACLAGGSAGSPRPVPISMALIPIDLKDMDFTDFIQSAKQYSPVTLFVLITNNILPDLSFLVTSNEIDAFTPEPLSVSSLIILRHTAIANRRKYRAHSSMIDEVLRPLGSV
jgi:hypothetical protein